MRKNETAEEWRAVPGTDGLYSVSSYGRVRSEPIPGRVGRQRGRILSPHADTKGYPIFVACFTSGMRWTAKVHRAVAAAFLGACPEGMQVNHKDGDKLNNHVENLEYVSCKDNIVHGWETGLYRPREGEIAGNVKLTEDDVRAIRAIYPAKSLHELGELYGVSFATIQLIVKRKTWKHVA